MDGAKIDKKVKNVIEGVLNKVTNKLGITNGDGFIILGVIWFLYRFLTYLFTSPENQFQQIVHENLFNQALMGVIIVGIGAILKKMK